MAGKRPLQEGSAGNDLPAKGQGGQSGKVDDNGHGGSPGRPEELWCYRNPERH